MVKKKNLTRVLLSAVFAIMLLNGHAQIFWSEDFGTDEALPTPAGWEIFDNNAGGGLWEITNIGPIGMYATDPLSDEGNWAMFDSATDCSGDQDTWLVTPAIDCSEKEIVWLRFDQSYVDFYCETYIRIATDEATPLAEWEEIQLNILNPNFAGPPEILLDISSYVAMEPTVFIAFEFRNVAGQSPDPSVDGCAYNWQVDNIRLYDENPNPDFDLAISDNFYAIAPNAMWPASQLEPFGFLSDIANNGQADQTGVQITVDMDALPLGNNVYTETLDFASIGIPVVNAGDVIENQLFESSGFLAEAEPGKYRGTYQVSSNETDAEPLDNTATFNFEVTENIFSKEDTISISVLPNTTNWPAEEPYSWSYGCHYFMPNGDGWKADKVSFALGNPSSVSGKKVAAILYEWEDVVIGNPTTIAPDQRKQIGFNEYTITGFEPTGTLITIDLADISTGETGVALKDGGHYILMLRYAASDQSTIVAFAGSDQKDYSAQILRAEELGEARYAGILVIGGLDEGTWSTVGFGRDIVPVARLHITDETTNVNTLLGKDDVVKVFPSPASDFINIHLEMAVLEEQINLSVVSSTGETFRTHLLKAIKTKDLQMDVSAYPVGSYFLRVQTEAGERSIPFVIQR